MARLRDDGVKQAAKTKIAELHERGVDVPGGGFLRRRFGGQD